MSRPLTTDLEFRDLSKRNIREDTARKFGYAYGTYGGRRCQVAPYHDAAGRVVAQKIRFPGKDFAIAGDPKGMRLFGQQLWKPGGKKLVITEGEIDALAMSQAQGNRWPVVSVPNGARAAARALQQELEFVESFEEVVFMFDMDEAGQEAARECCELLSPNKGRIATLPLKDAGEMVQAGRIKELIQAFWDARPYRPDGIVQGEEVWEHMTQIDKVSSVPLPHSGLQEKTHGLRGGEVVTFCAGTGVGKSTFCREVAVNIMDQGHSVGYVALEESVKRSGLGLMSIPMNRPLHLEELKEEDKPALREAFETYADRMYLYDHFGSLDSANLLAKIRFLIRGCGCNYIVLDHLSIVVSGIIDGDERRVIDNTMTALASLAQETGACILIVSHLRRTEGKAHEEGKAVSLSDLRGSGSIGQLSHTIIALERDQQGGQANVAEARVLKCRHTGMTGPAGFLHYTPKTGRLQECDEPGFAEFAPVSADSNPDF